jgi:hypothetical protein
MVTSLFVIRQKLDKCTGSPLLVFRDDVMMERQRSEKYSGSGQFTSKIPKTFLLPCKCRRFLVLINWSTKGRMVKNGSSEMLKAVKGKVRKSTLDSGN